MLPQNTLQPFALWTWHRLRSVRQIRRSSGGCV